MLCCGIQYNTSHFQINPEIYSLQNIRNFLWGLDVLDSDAISGVYAILT